MPYVFTEYAGSAGGRWMKAEQSVDQRRFSGAVGTQKADGSPIERAIQPLQDRAGSQPNLQVI
jgi:hypothetical protein